MRTDLVVLALTGVTSFAPSLATEEPPIKALGEALRSPDVQQRTRAAMALAMAGPAAKEALAELTLAVEDRNLNIRYWAASALRNIGPEAKSAVPALTRVLATFPGGVPELEGPLRYYADARALAAEALGSIGKGASAAIPALEAAAREENAFVREAASAALQKIRSQE